MDFVISKVAMSICALLVAGIMATALDFHRLADEPGELRDVLREFSGLVETALQSGSRGSIEWSVPPMSTGDRVTITVEDGVIRGESGGSKAVLHPSCELHTWKWNGSALNRTAVEALDASSKFVADSGQTIGIYTVSVQIGGDSALFVFVHSKVQ